VTQADKFALLRDLAHLVRKHGPSVFADLAGFLRDPETLTDLVMILESAATAGRKVRIPEAGTSAIPGTGPRAGMRQLLLELETNDPEKAQILSCLYEALAAKHALPTLRELRSFALDNNLEIINAKSRDKALAPFIRRLAQRSIEDLRLIVSRISMTDTSGDRTLEGWTKLILNKHGSAGGS
jgi:hypothetical protein